MRKYIESINRLRVISFALIAFYLLVRIHAIAKPSTRLLDDARHLIDQRQNFRALVCLNTLISKEPRNAEAYNERARVYLYLVNYEKSLEDCKKAILLNPKLAESYVNKATVLLEMAQFEESLKASRKAIDLNPRLPKAYFIRALNFDALKKFDQEIESWSKAISLEPNNFNCYLCRAKALRKLGKFDEGLQDCNKALNLSSNDSSVYIERGYIYFCLGKYQSALRDYTSVIKICPRSSEAYSLRSDVYKALGKYQKQIDDLNSACTLTPGIAELYERRGYAYFSRGEFQKAVEDYNATIKIAPNAITYCRRSDAFRELGEFGKQIEDLTTACKLKPNDMSIYEKRSLAFYRTGQLDKAVGDFSRISTLGTTSPFINGAAATAYEELGNLEKAIEFRSKILRIDQNDSFELCKRARNYKDLGKLRLAEADWRKAAEFAKAKERCKIELCNPLVNLAFPTKKKMQILMKKSKKINEINLLFHYDDEDHICFPAKVNDRDVQFVLDTGCDHTNVWKHTHSFPKSEIVELTGVSPSGTKYAYEFSRLRSLQLSRWIWHEVPVGIQEGLSESKNLGGFLGGNILENYVLKIDYLNKKITLSDFPDITKSSRSITVPMWIRFHRPHCNVKLDDKLEHIALLDTGCPFSMAADSLLKPLLSEKLVFKNHISGPWLGRLDSANVHLKSLDIGEYVFHKPVFCVYPATQAPRLTSEIILGNDFLSNFKTVTFDFPGRQVIFEPR